MLLCQEKRVLRGAERWGRNCTCVAQRKNTPLSNMSMVTKLARHHRIYSKWNQASVESTVFLQEKPRVMTEFYTARCLDVAMASERPVVSNAIQAETCNLL